MGPHALRAASVELNALYWSRNVEHSRHRSSHQCLTSNLYGGWYSFLSIVNECIDHQSVTTISYVMNERGKIMWLQKRFKVGSKTFQSGQNSPYLIWNLDKITLKVQKNDFYFKPNIAAHATLRLKLLVQHSAVQPLLYCLEWCCIWFYCTSWSKRKISVIDFLQSNFFLLISR